MSGSEANERKILVGVDEGDESMYALSWCLKNVVVPQNSKDTLVLLYAKKPRPIYPIIDGATEVICSSKRIPNRPNLKRRRKKKEGRRRRRRRKTGVANINRAGQGAEAEVEARRRRSTDELRRAASSTISQRRKRRGPLFSPFPRYVLMPDVMETMDRYNNELAESRMEKAKKLCKEVHNLNVKVETRIESGDPRDVICQAAEKLSADVVVLGSHGYGLIKRAFLGSVSNYCAQKAKCPVLIAKRPESTPTSKY